MSVQDRPIQVGWKVASLATNVASVRYRAVLPVLALESTHVRCRIFSSGHESNLDGLDALVIVKSFGADDLRLAQRAAERGIPVVYDLCDNIFIGDYGAKGGGLTPAQMFLAICAHASCVVATTEPLAEVIRQHLPAVPVVVIPDGIETASVGKRIVKHLRDAAMRERAQQTRRLVQRIANAVRRVRTEGVQVIPALVGYVVRRMGGAAWRRLHRGTHGRAAQPPAPAAPAGRPATRSIVWFGNHGAEHARFGMLDILEYRTALEAIAAEQDVELVVISNHRQKYEQDIAPLAIRSRYVEWSAREVDQWLRQAALVIIPNTLDPFSICKSANRTVLALAHGVPVVATMTPALQPLADFIHGGDPLAAIRGILADPQGARANAVEGYRRAESLYGMKAIQLQWLRLLTGLPQGRGADTSAQPYLAVVLHLVQDLDLALPILREARAAGVSCEAWCSGTVVKKSPRVMAALAREQIPLKMLPEDEALKEFSFPPATRALLTVAETNLGPHRVPRLLAEAALRQGLFVATLQHGFENVGLTFDDTLHGLDTVDIAAQRIYTWGPLHTLHPRVKVAVRARCMPVGCPKEARVAPADLTGLVPPDRPVVGIFENLHWHRYSDDYREAFIANVLALAQAHPDVLFLLKPHHAGLWLTKRYEGDRPAGDNLLVADPQAPEWERHTASALLERMTAVITSPSTVALDAARLRLPVAVAAGELYLENYRPLTLLETQQDWLAFVAQALDEARRPALQEQSARFVDLVLVPGNAAKRIVEDLRATAGP